MPNRTGRLSLLGFVLVGLTGGRRGIRDLILSRADVLLFWVGLGIRMWLGRRAGRCFSLVQRLGTSISLRRWLRWFLHHRNRQQVQIQMWTNFYLAAGR